LGIKSGGEIDRQSLDFLVPNQLAGIIFLLIKNEVGIFIPASI